MTEVEAIVDVALTNKRKADDDDAASETSNKVAKIQENASAANSLAATQLVQDQERFMDSVKMTGGVPVKARENRLEQNRKAARESRRRKKVMIEELQRSVIFFSRANAALKQQNDELTRMLGQAQLHVAQFGNAQNGEGKPAQEKKTAPPPAAEETKTSSHDEQTRANTVATQAIFESQGFPAAAARAAAQAVNGSLSGENSSTSTKPSTSALTHSANLPTMQPGATMQAMANFQQAAAAAMQQAMGQMKGVPGLTQMAATPVGGNPQHAFTDAMTAIAMQQAAAAAAAGHPFVIQGNMQLLPAIVQQFHAPAPATPSAPPTATTTQKAPATESAKSEPATVSTGVAQTTNTTEGQVAASENVIKTGA